MKGKWSMKNKLKLSIEENAYNEEKMLWHIMAQARSLGIKPVVKKTFVLPKFFKFGLATVLIAVFALLGITQLGDFEQILPDGNAITVIYALDINPSFELAVNKLDKVITISAINEDAKTIIIDDLLGKQAPEVIETLIKRSEAAGFIDSTDLVDDYVLVTTIPKTEDNQAQAIGFENKIKDVIKTSAYLQGLNVAVIKSDLITLKTAQDKKIPIGLYVINGMVAQPDGTFLSAKEFFSDPTNRETFQTKGDIKDVKENQVKTHILEALAKLDAIGVDTRDIKNRLITATDKEVVKIQVEVRKLLNKHKLGSTSEVESEGSTNT